MSNRKKSSFLKIIVVFLMLIIILAAHGHTMRTLISLDWVSETGDLVINFFTQ